MQKGKIIIFFMAFLLSAFCRQSVAQEVYDDYNADQSHCIQLPLPQVSHLPRKVLTLKEAILLALRTNPNVRSGEIQRISDKFALEVAHNQFEPQYQFTTNVTFAPGSQPQYTVAPQASLLTPLGTQLQVSVNQNFLNTAGTGSSITASATQPLLRGFGPKVTMAPLVQAEYSESVAQLNLKNTIMTTITTVIQNYYTLVQAYNSLDVDKMALQNSLAMLQQYRVKIKAGQMAPLELAPQESQVASQELQVTQDQNAIQQAQQALFITLGINPNSQLEIDRTIKVEDLKIPDLATSTDLALENNIAYLQAMYQLKTDQVQTFVAKDQQRWQLNLVASKVIIPNNGGTGGAVVPITTTGTGGTTAVTVGNAIPSGDSVQLNLNIPIDDKQLQQQLVNAEVALDQQKIQVHQTKIETTSNVLNFIQTLNFQVQQIEQAEEQVKYAQQAFNIEEIKLSYGRSTVLNVTQLRTTLTQAKQSLIAQQITYLNTLAQFEQTLGTSLDKWNIQVYY